MIKSFNSFINENVKIQNDIDTNIDDIDVDSDVEIGGGDKLMKKFNPYSHLDEDDTDDDKIEFDTYLKFTDGNEKLKKLGITQFSLPAGYTCPFADICKTLAHKSGGKFQNGKSIKDRGTVRCYAASMEMIYSSTTGKLRWDNFQLINKIKLNVDEMSDLIYQSIIQFERKNKKISILRIHESGDFFNQQYFDAWVNVAKRRSDILFYGYTKSIPYLVNRKNDIPINLRLIGSVGGKSDDLLFSNSWIRKAFIVDNEDEAIDRGLRIDVNEYLAVGGQEDFALLLHGTQSIESKKSKQGRENSSTLKDINSRFVVNPSKMISIINKYTK